MPKKAKQIIISFILLILVYPTFILFSYLSIALAISLSGNEYLNGLSKYSGDKKIYAQQALRLAINLEGNHIIPAGASLAYIEEIKYQPDDKLCVASNFTTSPKNVYGQYSAKVKRYKYFLIPKDEVIVGCSQNDFEIVSK
jgi:hypothetical protein